MRFIIGIVLFCIVFIAGAYVLFAGTNPQQTSPSVIYSPSDKERPIAEVKKISFDMGTIKVSDQKEAVFIVKNAGTRPLQLSNFTTSCGCTAVVIIYQGKTSDEFSMHAKGDYIAQIAPQTEASIKMIYRPYVMPVYGTVVREAYISTNDPNQPKLVFTVKAYVK